MVDVVSQEPADTESEKKDSILKDSKRYNSKDSILR